jgi:hypothetical protein
MKSSGMELFPAAETVNPLVWIDVQVLMSGFNQVTDDRHWQRQPHMFAVQQGGYQVGPADLQVKGWALERVDGHSGSDVERILRRHEGQQRFFALVSEKEEDGSIENH